MTVPDLRVAAAHLRVAAAGLSLAAVFAVTACTSAPEPMPTETAGQPAPSPTPEVLMVGPGERPPQVFDGDCEAMLTEAQASAVLGKAVTSAGSDESSLPTATLGGLVCDWDGSSAALRIAAYPAAALEGGPSIDEMSMGYYFTDPCDWYCGWLSDGDDLVVMGHVHDDAAPIARERADDLGAEVAGLIRSNAAAPDAEWAADRTGWWTEGDCEGLSAQASSHFGSPLELTESLYQDPPPAWAIVGNEVTGAWMCADATINAFIVTVEPGAAWAVAEPDMVPVDIGVEGWSASRPISAELGDYVRATDGVNLVTVSANEGDSDPDAIAAAVIPALVLQQQ